MGAWTLLITDQREEAEAGAWSICMVVEVLPILLGRAIMLSPHCKQGGVRHRRECIQTKAST